MTDVTEQVLLHIKYLDDHAASQPSLHGVVSGASLRVVARETVDGRVKVSGSVSHRIHRLRASGQAFRYWRQQIAVSLVRTKQDLVVLRTLLTVPRKASTQHLFDDAPYHLGDMVEQLRHHLLLPMHDMERDHLQFVEGPGHWLTGLYDLVDEIGRRIGDLPSAAERFPLLTNVYRFAPGLYGHMFFLDAHDYRRVAENVFGKTRYRKPLAREIERLTRTEPTGDNDGHSDDFRILNWFRLFRGLVPIDWIIESMRATPRDVPAHLESTDLIEARRLLRRVPEPILRRILAEPPWQAMRIIGDTARQIGTRELRYRDLDLLPELIAARGQRRIRGAQDLENLVRGMPAVRLMSAAFARSERAVAATIREYQERQEMDHYNRAARYLGNAPTATWELWQDPEFRGDAEGILADFRRELMDANERERAEREEKQRQERVARENERAAWAAATADRLDGLIVEDLRIVVARDADTLAYWGSALNNCISTYANDLGLDVFAAVVDKEGRIRLNVQIEQAHGITQFLGPYNREAIAELGEQAQTVLNAFADAGAPPWEYALGVEGLTGMDMNECELCGRENRRDDEFCSEACSQAAAEDD
ncbi:PcfJ domain-containing protein [Actinomadura geliboluensis]|uniref:PcfJ domain-containing protein n=1 Tax=Actinomadura geliboluensis TaxID=882440 RepID=UPI003722EA35